MKIQSVRLLVLASISMLFISRVMGEQKIEATPKITFDDHVKPIFRQHCSACHSQGEKKGGLDLDAYTALLEGGASGEIVFDDGDYDGSRLWQLINHDDTPIMPPNKDKIPAEQLEIVRKWIEGGILENSGSKAKEKKKNSLAFIATGGGRPEGGGAMPETLPQRVPVLTARPAATSAIAASPWAPLVAIAGQKQISFYNTDTNELLGIVPFEEGIAQALRFSRDGSFLIAGGGEHSVKGVVAVYDVKTGERVAVVGDELDTVFDGDANDSMTRIALGGPKKMLRIFDAADGTKLFDLKKHTDWIYTVAYSPDGVLIASGDRSGGLCVWEAETGRLYLDLTDHKGAVHAVAWRDDSNMLASASADGTVKLWDMNQGKAIKSISVGGGVHDVAFDHQGRLVTAGQDNKAKLWDASGNHVRDFQPMSEDVLEVEISHDGKRVIYGDWTGQVFVVDTEDPGKKQALAANPPPAKERLEEVKQTLVSVQAELAPLNASLDQAKQAMEAAKKPIDEQNAKIAAKKAEAVTIAEQAAALEKQFMAIDGQLPALTASSRDLQDVLIAARVAAKGADATDAGQLQGLATAEQALAAVLMDLAAKRRQRVEDAAKAAAMRAAVLAAEQAAQGLAEALPPMQQKLQQSEAVVTAAQAAQNQVAGRLSSVQRKHDLLAAEVN